MEKLLTKKQKIKATIGSGYISLFEAVKLKVGDVVRVDTMAGEAVTVSINNFNAFTGEIIIMRDKMGVMVTKIYSEKPKEYSGVKDSITEIVRTEIVINEIELSIEDLINIHKNSLISFDKLYDNINFENSYLYIEGSRIAKGKTLLYEEYFAIELTEIYYQPEIEVKIPIRTSGFILDKNNPSLKIYDFRKPDKFTFRQILRIKDIHNAALRNMKLLIPEISDYKIQNADQMRFDEIFPLIQSNYSYNIIYSSTIEKREETIFENQIYVLQKEDFKYKVDNENIEYIKNVLSFRSGLNSKNLIICRKKGSIFSKISGNSSISELIAEPIRNGWKEIKDIRISEITETDDFEKIKIIPPADMILIVTVGNEMLKDEIIIIYPFIFLEFIIDMLG